MFCSNLEGAPYKLQHPAGELLSHRELTENCCALGWLKSSQSQPGGESSVTTTVSKHERGMGRLLALHRGRQSSSV